MKIGLVCPYNIFLGGGVLECVKSLQAGLVARGHEAVIIAPRPGRLSEPIPKGVVLVGGSRNVRAFRTTAQVAVSVDIEALESMLEQYNFDVLHFHEPWVPILSRQILSRANCPVVATFHAKLPETILHRTIEKAVTPYTKSILSYIDVLTAVSDAAADYVETLTDRPIQIIPNGIDLDKYQKTVNGEQKTNNSKQITDSSKQKTKDKKTIFYVGRLENRKGVKYLLKAFQILSENQPDQAVELVIAGSGPDREKLEEYVELNGLKNVKFLGFINDATKLKWLQAADLFCSPALYGESFGIVLLEAMAVGLPVVAGDNPGYVSVMKDRGAISIVNPKDSREFAGRLELLLYDEHLRSLWQKWAGEYVKQFSYNNIIDKYERLYKQLAKT